MCLSGNVGDAVLGMDPGSALIHEDVVFSLSAPCPVLTKKGLPDIRQNVICLCLDLECVYPEMSGMLCWAWIRCPR